MGTKSSWNKKETLRVCGHDVFDPIEELAHFDIDTGEAWLATALAPRDQPMHRSIAYQRTACISLTKTSKITFNFILIQSFVDVNKCDFSILTLT